MASHSAYIRKETVISMVVNALISAAFTWAVFGGQQGVPVWGWNGVAVDFIPQTFMIAAMSVLVPTLLTRSRRKAGVILSPHREHHAPRNVVVRAVAVAFAATVIFAGVAIAALAWSGTQTVGIATLFPIKIAYGSIVALIVTPLALRAELRSV